MHFSQRDCSKEFIKKTKHNQIIKQMNNQCSAKKLKTPFWHIGWGLLFGIGKVTIPIFILCQASLC